MIRIQKADFDVGQAYNELCDETGNAGAVVFFVGRVRGKDNGQGILALELEHYPGMCEQQLDDLCREAQSRWPCEAIHIIHRVGRLCAGEQIVFVGVASRHRDSAFTAGRFLMDQLKTRAPFWKKEHLANSSRWLSTRAEDTHAARLWYKDAVHLA
jgi:molybdopterin synthase catalytic subunit